MRLALLFVAVALCGAQAQERWRLQYFHDEDDSVLTIADLKFASPKAGVAIGVLRDGQDVKPMSVVTTDGGAHWSEVPLKEIGRSLFFLNDSLGWMVTQKGLWRTEESGRSWRKIKAPAGIIRVRFLNPERGFAVCERKQAYETGDGGQTWTKLAFAAGVKAREEHTAFTWIEFADKDVGLIGGTSRPPRPARQRLPDWLDPETASHRRAWPQLTIIAETRDGGNTWAPTVASLFGEITAVRFSPRDGAVALLEFHDAFDWPSEVVRSDRRTGAQKRIYREKNRKITDIGVDSGSGNVLLAGIEHHGKLQDLPAPRKVRILTSAGGETFAEMPVDYRASARRVTLASAGAGQWWAATDTGMILKLSK